MALEREAGWTPPRPEASSASKPLELCGDSPELVAFALMRYLAQLEQQGPTPVRIDRTWLLDSYAECLSAVRGHRIPKAAADAKLKRPAGGKRY